MNQSKRHRTQLAAMGHTVKSVNGEEVGGVQSIMFVAAPRPAHSDEPGSAKRVNGYYRSGSDFKRMDKLSVGEPQTHCVNPLHSIRPQTR